MTEPRLRIVDGWFSAIDSSTARICFFPTMSEAMSAKMSIAGLSTTGMTLGPAGVIRNAETVEMKAGIQWWADVTIFSSTEAEKRAMHCRASTVGESTREAATAAIVHTTVSTERLFVCMSGMIVRHAS